MVGDSNQKVFLIQIDASSFAEFEISEFESQLYKDRIESGLENLIIALKV